MVPGCCSILLQSSFVIGPCNDKVTTRQAYQSPSGQAQTCTHIHYQVIAWQDQERHLGPVQVCAAWEMHRGAVHESLHNEAVLLAHLRQRAHLLIMPQPRYCGRPLPVVLRNLVVVAW